jgi:hypothetical protein
MSYQEREDLVATVQETYALMGRALNLPLDPGLMAVSIRQDVMSQIAQAIIYPYVTDQAMLLLLQDAYSDLLPTVSQIDTTLRGDNGAVYDNQLANVGLTGSGHAAKVGGFRRALGRVFSGVPGFQRVKKAFEWGNIILGSLRMVPVIGTLVEPIKELKESIEAQGDDDQAPHS